MGRPSNLKLLESMISKIPINVMPLNRGSSNPLMSICHIESETRISYFAFKPFGNALLKFGSPTYHVTEPERSRLKCPHFLYQGLSE